MGSYLTVPVTEKHSENGNEGADRLEFAVSEMQGWRKTMEDAHVSSVSITKEQSDHGSVGMFAVFDGHGGKEVAGFCAKYMPQEIQKLKSFERGDFKTALVEAFFRMDEMLQNPTFSHELARFRDLDVPISVALKTEQDESSDRDNAREDEASTNMPLSVRESMQADVSKQMAEAEEKGSLSKTEALDLIVKMMKLKKLDEREAGATQGAETVIERFTEAGATAIVALIHDEEMYVANAGDSRAIMCSDGKAVALSKDHKPFHEKELDRIRRAGGYVNEFGRVNGNLNLSRSIGDLKYKSNAELGPEKQLITALPDVEKFVLSEKDEYMFIACDGVFDVMSNEDVVSFVNKRLAEGVEPLSAILEQIFEECICDSPGAAQGIGADNMTAILVLFKPRTYFTS